jgi:hypothetical protein
MNAYHYDSWSRITWGRWNTDCAPRSMIMYMADPPNNPSQALAALLTETP